jgi:two-component system response regulator HydG
VAAHQPYRGHLVVLDDETGMTRGLGKLLTVEGFHVTTFNNPAEALAYLGEHAADVLLSDMRMPGMMGREVLAEVLRRQLGIEVVLMTGYGTIDEAVECVRMGAYDYVAKPVNPPDLIVTLTRAVEKKRLREVNARLSVAYTPGPAGSADELLGISTSIAAVRDLIARVAPTDSAVLVVGESGTGKELAARALHRLSRRARGRYVAINCASIPETLMESELFGHERGAFTGASEAKAGLIEVADGGTLFLDEIGEMPVALQAKLLRALQEHEITRVGGRGAMKVDIRVVAATNRELPDMIRQGRFREDLYYRLNVITVRMPPLRERREDIPILAEAALRDVARRDRRPELRFGEGAIALLARMDFPGNVRQLRNTVERLAVLADQDVITGAAVSAVTAGGGALAPPVPATASLSQAAEAMLAVEPDFRAARDQFEREYLRALLRKHGGSVTNAAKSAGMSRRNLYEKVEKLGISRDEFDASERE